MVAVVPSAMIEPPLQSSPFLAAKSLQLLLLLVLLLCLAALCACDTMRHGQNPYKTTTLSRPSMESAEILANKTIVVRQQVTEVIDIR